MFYLWFKEFTLAPFKLKLYSFLPNSNFANSKNTKRTGLVFLKSAGNKTSLLLHSPNPLARMSLLVNQELFDEGPSAVSQSSQMLQAVTTKINQNQHLISNLSQLSNIRLLTLSF